LPAGGFLLATYSTLLLYALGLALGLPALGRAAAAMMVGPLLSVSDIFSIPVSDSFDIDIEAGGPKIQRAAHPASLWDRLQ
jgi:hypothetical protein